MEPELKIFDRGGNGNIPSNGTWNPSRIDPTPDFTLFSPPEGINYKTRIGNKCFVHRILIRFGICVTPVDNDNHVQQGSLVRIILYRDKITNGAQLIGSQLFESVSPSAQTFIFWNKEVDNYDRVDFLKDIIIPIIPSGISVTPKIPPALFDSYSWGGRYYPFEWDITFKDPIPVQFMFDASLNIAISDNSFHLMANSTATNMTLTYSYTSRVWYDDNH